MPFDFSSAVEAKDTDYGQAIKTSKFDFSSTEETPKTYPISTFMRSVMRFTLPEIQETVGRGLVMMAKGYSVAEVMSRLNDREDEIISRGAVSQLDKYMAGLVVAGLATAPVSTAVGLGTFALVDKLYNGKEILADKYPDAPGYIEELVEIGDFFSKAVVGGVLARGSGSIFQKFIGKKSVGISSNHVSKISNSSELLPEEKLDISATLGMTEKHVSASVASKLPVDVPIENVIDLANKPYWERLKTELVSLPQESMSTVSKQDLIPQIKSLQAEKDLSNITVARLKKFIGIDNLKKADVPQLDTLKKFIGDLKKEDKFLTEKQLSDLKDIVRDIPNVEVTPKRIIVNNFGEKDQILPEGIMGKVINELIPTVNIKEGHPLITKIVDGAKEKIAIADNNVSLRNKEFDALLSKAEKERSKMLPVSENLSRSIYPRNKEVFKALSGESVSLTDGEKQVVSYLKDFFSKAKETLSLERSRRNYVSHIEKDFMEKVLDNGLINSLQSLVKKPNSSEIPTNILLELDNIIGSEKFFKFALERKGGTDPTTNLRKIVNEYSRLYESKIALDQILPEGQAIVNNLLEGKSAQWTKRFLQNLKGRGLDYNFRNGKMGWLAKVADNIIDIGYIKMLSLNYKSAIKNVVAGETNSWIYQDFPKYLEGKRRLLSNPRKAYNIAKEYGILDGTYADYAQKGIGGLKKLQDFGMIGQKAGEIEIRSSLLASMLSKEEWNSGVISKESLAEINNVIAKTQGTFSSIDSPLVLQTWYGRMFFQMNRWRITNAMLLREVSMNALKDVKQGNFNTQNVSRFGKMITAYGVGMYVSSQLYNLGYNTAGDVTRNMAQTIDGTISLFSKGELMKMFNDNPTLQVLSEISNTIQEAAYYYYVPGADPARGNGIEDTYIAPVQSMEDILESVQ